ncbi:MAG: FHA domain-containing protein, partial [Chloroflexota bacterium]
TVSRRKPDVDLEDYEGYRFGVSRKHALFALLDQQLSLQDSGSANGTFLNGVRLPAHQAHKVHDGDVIQLGHMTIRIYFAGSEEDIADSE